MLAKCCECGKEISTSALKCPYCGYEYGHYIASDSIINITYKKSESGYKRMSKEECWAAHKDCWAAHKDSYKKEQEKLEKAAKEKEEQNRSSGCFIATAAYGTPLANEVGLLRQFRDDHLVLCRAGRMFITSYYRLSPPIAEIIKQSRVLRSITRAILRPVIWLLRK